MVKSCHFYCSKISFHQVITLKIITRPYLIDRSHESWSIIQDKGLYNMTSERTWSMPQSTEMVRPQCFWAYKISCWNSSSVSMRVSSLTSATSIAFLVFQLANQRSSLLTAFCSSGLVMTPSPLPSMHSSQSVNSDTLILVLDFRPGKALFAFLWAVMVFSGHLHWATSITGFEVTNGVHKTQDRDESEALSWGLVINWRLSIILFYCLKHFLSILKVKVNSTGNLYSIPDSFFTSRFKKSYPHHTPIRDSVLE